MTKYLAFSVLVILTVGLVVRELLVLPTGYELHFLDMLAEHQRVRDKVAAQRLFHEALESTLACLARGEMRLKEGAESVYEAAQEHSPTYLRMVQFADPADCIQHSIAHNLVGHLRMRSSYEPNLCAAVLTLEAELSQLGKETNPRS